MDIKLLRTLISIADHRSFQAAAKAMEMSVSNVSLQITALEDHLGVKLFDRSSKPARLTEVGSEFVSKSRKLVTSWEELSSSVINHQTQGALKVGAVHTSVAGSVATALGKLRSRNPNVFLQLHTALTPQLIKQLQSHSIDCAIVTEPESAVMDTQFIPLAQDELGVIAHRDAVGDDFQTLLQQNPYLRFNRHATLAQVIDTELKRRNIQVKSTMEITTLDAIESLVKNGLGVSVVPMQSSTRSRDKDIRLLPFSESPFYRNLGLLVRNDCPRGHLVDLLTEELRTAYQN